MNDDRAFERATRDWLEEGSDRTPPVAIDAVLLAVRTTSQERDLRIPWRTPFMTTPIRAAAGIAIVAVVGIAVLSLIGRGFNVGAPRTQGPTATPAPTAATVAPTVLGSVDTATWRTYTSTRYGFTIGHPADWIARPADHAWTLQTAPPSSDPEGMGTSAEGFIAPDGSILVSAWSVAVAPGVTAQTWLVVLYCGSTEIPTPSDGAPCDRLGPGGPRVTPVAIDRHAGTLVRFTDDTQAFFLIDNRMYVVACWRPESDGTVAAYGGATRLLEAFISTIHVVPDGSVLGPTSAPAS